MLNQKRSGTCSRLSALSRLLVFSSILALPLSAYSQAEPGSEGGATGTSGPLGVAPQQQVEDGYLWHSSATAATSTYPGDGSTAYAYNPTGDDIEVVRNSTGSYDVTVSTSTQWFLPTVTAYGNAGAHCNLSFYGWSSGSIDVDCWDSAGNPEDSRFSLRWTTTTEDAYAYIDSSGGATCCQNNAWGAAITATNPSVGSYVVTTPGGPQFEGGNVFVTAYGGTSNQCSVDFWGSTAANISCYDSAGTPVNNAFTFLRIGSEDDAYAWANAASSTTTYTPSTFYSHNPQGNPEPTAIKTATGAYTVTFPDLRHGFDRSFGGNVQVTAYGSGSSTKCNVQSWGSETANVRCSNSAGAATDSRFDVLYTRFITCNDEVVTVDLYEGQTPTLGDDVISGTDGDDDIRGRRGEDTICGRGGDDFIHGNMDDDWIDGGAGVDTIKGGFGDDVIYVGTGATVGVSARAFGGYDNDKMFGGPDADDLRGGRGDDEIYGGGGNDELTGNEDDDYVAGESGNDEVKGGNGDDELYGGSGADEVNGGSGTADFCDHGGNAGDVYIGCELF